MAEIEVGVLVQDDDVYIHASDLDDYLSECEDTALAYLDAELSESFRIARLHIAEIVTEALG